VEVEQEKNSTTTDSPVIIYGRVSSSGQAKGFGKGSEDNDLARQLQRLKDHACEHYGCESPLIYSDVGSGLSESREGYNRLIDAILSGKHNGATLLITHKDRLSRFSPSIFLKICDHADIKVVFIEANDTVEQAAELAQDVVMIIQVYGARICSARSAERSRIVLTPAQMNEVFRLHKVGHSSRDIAKALEGQLSENGKPITYGIIQNMLRKNAKVLEQLVDTSGLKNSFQRFEAETIRTTSKQSIVSKARILELYHAWCEAKGEQPLSDKNIGSYYKRKGIETRYSRTGSLLYVGLSLITNKS
jgi:predicted site-specific integrase-resolvase